MTQDWQTPFQSLKGVTIESAGGAPIEVKGTVDWKAFHLCYKDGEWKLEIGQQEPWDFRYVRVDVWSPDEDAPSPVEVASMLADAFREWRAERTQDARKTRRRLNVYLNEQRKRLRQIDDADLAELVADLDSVVPDASFDAIEFLCTWLLRPVPALGGLTPADVLAQPGGLERVKDILGRWSVGVAV